MIDDLVINIHLIPLLLYSCAGNEDYQLAGIAQPCLWFHGSHPLHLAMD